MNFIQMREKIIEFDTAHPEDVVFTEEYFVRSARIVVYKLLGVNKPIEPINQYQYDIRTLFSALVTSFR
ncbi:MAG: hypothetical protein ACM3TR_14150 [Caulobacteraceae bacterium]